MNLWIYIPTSLSVYCANFSIELRTAFGDNKPFLIYKDKDEFPPPENILEILKKEAKRVGFKVAEDSI